VDRIVERIRELTGQTVTPPPRIIDDTTEFMGIDRGDVLRRFAVGECVRYGSVDEVADDLETVVGGLSAAV
jgi:hypothetical protein